MHFLFDQALTNFDQWLKMELKVRNGQVGIA